jgi:hypothetical protein
VNSEKTIAEHIQTQIRTLLAFENGSVTINDSTYLDGPIESAPFFSVYTSSQFESSQSQCPGTLSLDMQCVLLVEFVDWQESLDSFRDIRQNIVDLFTTSNATAIRVNSESVPSIKGIRAATDITGITYTEGDTTPVYLEQFMVFVTEQYS